MLCYEPRPPSFRQVGAVLFASNVLAAGRSRSAPSLLELPDEDGASSSSPGVVSCTRSSMRDQPNYRTQTFVGDIETKGK